MRCDVTIATGSLRMRLPRLRWASFLSSYQSIFLSFSLSLSLSLLSTSQWHWLVDRCLRISCQVPSKYTSHYKHMAGWTRTKWFQFNKIAHIWSRWHFIGHRFQRWSQGRIKVRGPIRPFCLALEKKKMKMKGLGACVCVCVCDHLKPQSELLTWTSRCGLLRNHPGSSSESIWAMAFRPLTDGGRADASTVSPRPVSPPSASSALWRDEYNCCSADCKAHGETVASSLGATWFSPSFSSLSIRFILAMA